MLRLLVAAGLAVFTGCAAEPPQPRAPFLPEVYVEYRADNRAAILERRYRDMPWIPVCESPCRRTVRPDFEYRVAGDNVVPSQPFRLYEPTSIDVRAGSRSSRSTGIVGLSIGLPIMIVGAFMTLFTFETGKSDAFWTSALVFGTGTALTVGGGWLLSDGHTVVRMYDRAPVAKVAFKF